MLRFDGRVAVVTGAGNGLGREYALLLASRGCKVVVNDLGGGRNGEGASSRAADVVVNEIRRDGGEAVPDYNSVEQGDKIVATAINNYGRIDIVINNAGILRDKAFVNMTEAEFDIIHRVHLKGSFAVTKAAWPYMRKQGYGKVIMTASAAGIFGNFGQANYASAKLALLGLSNTLAIEGRKYNIAVNTMVPTAASRLTEDIMPAEIFEKLKPHFVSPITVWLCHEECTETGGCFEAAGGFVAKYQFFRSVGKAFIDESLTLESLRDNWDSVTNLQGARPLFNVQEQTISVVQALSGEAPPPGALTPAQTSQTPDEDESVFRYNIDSAILYHLAVGVSTKQPDHLRFLYENADDFSVLPSFGVIISMSAVFNSAELHEAIGRINGDPARMLHGEQFLELLKPLPPSAAVKTEVRISDVLDKGSGAVVVVDADTRDVQSDELLARSQWLVFFVGAGGFGGPRSSNKVVPIAQLPTRQPDVVLEDQTSIDQAALYRLCGDKNPLHIDPTFAAMGGWQQPIMHGLCSLGYSTRHVMKAFANNDMGAFKSLKVRFTGPVVPGETVRTCMWKDGSRVLFETVAVESGKTVIGGGVIELRNPNLLPAPPRAIGFQAAPHQPDGEMAGKPELKTDMVFEGMRFRVEEQPDLIDKIQAIFEYHITLDGKTVATWTLDLKNGKGAVYEGPCKDGKPNCVVTISDDDMFNMAVGQLDPQKAFMTGKIKIRGNIMLMQKLRLLLKPPPEKQEDAAPAPVSLSGELRCKAIFSTTNKKVAKSPDLAADIQTIFQFDILKGGQLAYQYTLDLKNGKGCGYEGPATEKPDCILIMEDDILDKVHSGKLDAQRAFMTQKLKIKGNVLASQKLADIWADERENESDDESTPSSGNSSAAPVSLVVPQGAPKTVKADFIFNIFLYHLHQDRAMGEYITSLVKCTYHWVILQKGKKASEWTSDLKTGKGDLYNEAPRGGVHPEVQITIDDEDLVQLMLGKLNPQKAFMQGRLKIRGNIMLMQKFNTLWQEILKSGRVVELKLVAPLLSDGQPLSPELWSDYKFFQLSQRLAHLPTLVGASKGRSYHFRVSQAGQLKSEWTIDLETDPGAIYRGAPKNSGKVCEIAMDDLAIYHLVEGTLSPQKAFAQANINDRSAIDAIMPLFISKSKL
ncbi:peroxisomal multifunctional enzyme type 2-like [Tropilaelaps mercedesae]|uniref:Peroxisomal multifunctional enzyme type 2 n=1 Tax=Tropilaelaps mercedesae TaxID=418985 RepID=A0A1V9XZG0_9ACAR|nr:peroxisomal multifunctional enzyme type 2-like [Tropilaelaps mercedesae]